ncbi:MAG: hypothetical protein ACP5QT_06515 [Brevinematia bacterium]
MSDFYINNFLHPVYLLLSFPLILFVIALVHQKIKNIITTNYNYWLKDWV